MKRHTPPHTSTHKPTTAHGEWKRSKNERGTSCFEPLHFLFTSLCPVPITRYQSLIITVWSPAYNPRLEENDKLMPPWCNGRLRSRCRRWKPSFAALFFLDADLWDDVKTTSCPPSYISQRRRYERSQHGDHGSDLTASPRKHFRKRTLEHEQQV